MTKYFSQFWNSFFGMFQKLCFVIHRFLRTQTKIFKAWNYWFFPGNLVFAHTYLKCAHWSCKSAKNQPFKFKIVTTGSVKGGWGLPGSKFSKSVKSVKRISNARVKLKTTGFKKKILNQILPIKNKTVSVGPVKDRWGGPKPTIFQSVKSVQSGL